MGRRLLDWSACQAPRMRYGAGRVNLSPPSPPAPLVGGEFSEHPARRAEDRGTMPPCFEDRMSSKRNPIRPFRDSFSRPAHFVFAVGEPSGRPIYDHNYYPPAAQSWWAHYEAGRGQREGGRDVSAMDGA